MNFNGVGVAQNGMDLHVTTNSTDLVLYFREQQIAIAHSSFLEKHILAPVWMNSEVLVLRICVSHLLKL